MEQFSGLNMDMEQDMAGAVFEDCGQENPFEESFGSDAFDDDGDEDVFQDEDEGYVFQKDCADGTDGNGRSPQVQGDASQKEAAVNQPGDSGDKAEPDEKDSEYDPKRAEHEAAEAKRRAEWEARQQAKRDAEQAQIERIASMSDEDLMAESMKRVSTDTEKLTRRNMKECVAEYIQTLCVEDPAFARLVMNPKKNMVRCFQYISRKAWEYVQDELKANGIKPERGMQPYGCDLPDDLCYHWAEEYFRTPDVKEDQEEEEKFVPKPYYGGTSSKSKAKKKGEKKKTASVKPEIKKTEKKPASNDGQLSFIEQLSSGCMASSEVKAAG